MTLKSLAVNIKRMILYVLAELKCADANGGKNPILAMACVLSSLLLVFTRFARLCQQEIPSTLKGNNLGIYPFQGIKSLATCLRLSEAKKRNTFYTGIKFLSCKESFQHV